DAPDPAWLIPRALGHERVLGTVLAGSAVLPARFGSIFFSNEALAGLAAGHLGVIGRYFETVGDQREWSPRGYVETEAAVARALGALAAVPLLPGTRGARAVTGGRLAYAIARGLGADRAEGPEGLARLEAGGLAVLHGPAPEGASAPDVAAIEAYAGVIDRL